MSTERGTVESVVEVVDTWERMSEIWSERFGTAGEKVVLRHDSPYVPLSKTNISDGDIELSDDTSEESEVSGSDEQDKSWISWFCSLRENKFLCEVADDFILDDFNLCRLSSQVPYYDKSLDLILDEEPSSDGEIITEEQNELIESAAEMLYGLIHARFLLTFQGFRSMLNKYDNHEFGRCPRVNCRGQPCLPIGLSDIPRKHKVKIFCPKCEDVYDPQSKYHGSILFSFAFDTFSYLWLLFFFKHMKTDIDGAYFGTTFPHLFLMNYDCLSPEKVSQNYVPRVFGFKLHKP